MARKSSSDRILTEADHAERLEAIAEYQRKNGDPRKTYLATYVIQGQEQQETVRAMTQQQALDQVKYNCSLVGWQPMKLEVTEVV